MKRSTITMALAALALAGCVKQEVVGGGGTATSLGSSLVIEQFMRATNLVMQQSSTDPSARAQHLATMGRLFGTKAGSATEKWPNNEMELRMYAIARELTHEDFEITGEQMVPGRDGEATRVMVKVTKNGRDYTVPFTLVRYKDSWLIEIVDLEVITNAR